MMKEGRLDTNSYKNILPSELLQMPVHSLPRNYNAICAYRERFKLLQFHPKTPEAEFDS